MECEQARCFGTSLTLDRGRPDSMPAQRVVIIGGGAAGLSAAYTLRKRGFEPLVLEANDRVGGRLGGDRVDGFRIDAGADFFCSSYDETFRICKELGLSLQCSQMKLGWFRNGRWVVTTPVNSLQTLLQNWDFLQAFGFLSPGAIWPALKLVWGIRRDARYLNFGAACRIADLDREETFGDYLDRIRLPQSLRLGFRGFLEMTMGEVEVSGSAYMRTYLSEMFLKSAQLYVPEHGASSLAHALAAACRDAIRVSAPVRRVVIRDGLATSVILDGGSIDADAIICAVPATRVLDLVPGLSNGTCDALARVTYSTGCRVVIGLDHPPLPLGWHGALYPEDDTPLMLDRSINLPACVPPGMSTIDMLVGRERAEELIQLDDEEIKRQMLDDVRRNPPPGSALPNHDEGAFTRVYRWREAVCMGQPGMFRAVAAMRTQLSRDVRNLFLAGDYMRVPCVNGAVASGIAAAEDVANRLESQSA